MDDDRASVAAGDSRRNVKPYRSCIVRPRISFRALFGPVRNKDNIKVLGFWICLWKDFV